MDLKKIAKLSRLDFSAAEEAELSQQLEKILSAFEKIKAIPTTDVEPLVTPVSVAMHLRPDESHSDVNTDEYIALAPEASGRLYKVPRVIS
ncbi:MAG: Asp-tRNA(Asn)/Glu-tRNA(Gln) amidotransferase subunit GatC [Bdellovibrionales bacterium]|nr:Asp-tRNA(Asn)/Glu-tRNA(Gln) amidotransferase subunit GatC [Bdellovibrionales bacterium]